MKTLEQMVQIVGGSCRTKSPEDTRAIAQLCVDNNWCAWHGFSQFYQLTCFCHNCRPDIKRFV